MPATVLGAFAGFERLRRYWHGSGPAGRAPVAHSWTLAAIALVLLFFALSPDPYGWVQDLFYRDYGFNATDDGSNIRLTLWTSPTQTFGALLFVPLMLVLLDLLREHGGDRRRRLAFLLLPAAVMGAKASFLPTLFCGLLLVLAVHGLVRRRVHGIAAAALGVVLGWLVFAQLVLFGGESQGLGPGPLDALRRNPAGVSTHYTEDPRVYRLIVLLALTVLAWLAIWGAALGLRRRLLHPDAVLLLGLGLAGFSILVLFGHSGGQAEGFFLQGARPYLAALATWGLLSLPRPRRVIYWLGAGALLIYVVRFLDGAQVPAIGPTRHAAAVTAALVWPWAVIAAVALAGLLLARRSAKAYAVVAVFLLGCTAPTAVRQIVYAAQDGRANGWSERADLWPIVTEGTLEAGRWLRDHSSPNDLVATNMHCAYEGRRGHSACDRRHFGIAAYSERRVLVESWAYTAEAHDQEAIQGVPQEHTAYWNPRVLADNDAAFARPSPETIGVLRDRYHVRWLFTEDDIMPPSPDLSRYATLTFRSGACAVYRVG
ncbi:hypothetical protein ACPPVO_59040 [Dactylosporangium sp. McL0621]|uniref:hypothetical protein n=1 Tax=Dactylosporangium sp. McL0621 TaxID=3415678 RepID=UPI003CF73BAB